MHACNRTGLDCVCANQYNNMPSCALALGDEFLKMLHFAVDDRGHSVFRTWHYGRSKGRLLHIRSSNFRPPSYIGMGMAIKIGMPTSTGTPRGQSRPNEGQIHPQRIKYAKNDLILIAGDMQHASLYPALRFSTTQAASIQG